jgi:hypothetical protein
MKRSAILFMLLALALPARAGDVVREVNPASGLSTWRAEYPAFRIELIQLLPDFVRAVFASKGLPQEVIDAVSSYCVFGTIVRNRSAAPLSYNTADWRYVTADGVAHVGKSKAEWVGEWRDQGIAFRWTLLPEAQTFQVGDWGQGFTTVKLPPATRFDLHYGWSQHGETVRHVIKDMQCAPEDIEK